MKLPVFKPLYYLLKMFGCPVEWEISVGAVVFREESQKNNERLYLLLHYPSGHFDFPKGHVEEGETEEMTLRRETEEETGINDLEVYKSRVSIKYFYDAKGGEKEKREKQGIGTWIFKQVHFYPAKTESRDVTISHEHQGHVWEPYELALNRVTFENARRVLTETEEYLKQLQ